jgi:hypothetical protein
MPLEDVKVLDLSHALAGPFCSTMLADYGALNYSFVKIPKTEAAGAYADAPVIMSINGVKADLPRTVWFMSTTREPPGGGPPSTPPIVAMSNSTSGQ